MTIQMTETYNVFNVDDVSFFMSSDSLLIQKWQKTNKTKTCMAKKSLDNSISNLKTEQHESNHKNRD